MKLSPSWLRDFVDFKVDYRQLADELTLAGIAVEGISGEGDSTVYEMEITTNRPEIYFGENSNEYVFVRSKQPEFDYPVGDKNVYSRYEGRQIVRRAAPAELELAPGALWVPLDGEAAVRAALDKVPQLDPHDIDDLMLGCGLPGKRRWWHWRPTIWWLAFSLLVLYAVGREFDQVSEFIYFQF